MRAATVLRGYARSLAGLRRWLAETISFEQARARVIRRLETRDERFLRLLRLCVFENPRSPYLPLLRAAHCEYEDLERGIRRRGIEEELRRLKDAGVWVSLEEFKGRAPIVRRAAELRPAASDFDNPVVSPIVAPGTGGSSGRPVRSVVDLEHLAVRATYQGIILKLIDCYGLPLALWYPRLPAASGAVSSLMYAKLGQPPVRWFDVEAGSQGGSGWQGRLLTSGLVVGSRVAGRPLAAPEPGPIDAVLGWLLRARDCAGRCFLQSYVSRAVRLSQVARLRGRGLEGVTFHVGAEPLTVARHDAIRASGAAVFPRYSSTEMGTIAVGCTDSSHVGDHHLCRDLAAVVQADAGEADPPGILHLTSLDPATPKVMINVQLGDCAQVVRRTCGCILGRMGLDLHLLQVRSIGRVTCEGMTVAVSELVRIAEEVLCPRHGGSPLDYQWAEREDRQGKGLLLLRVSPDVAAVDGDRMARDVLEEVARRSQGSRIVAGLWREAGTLRVVRERPRLTASGKAVPFLRESPA